MKNLYEVPSYTAQSLRSKLHLYCVCVFVLNEGDRIKQQLQKMAEFSSSIDIIIADGGSTDGALSNNLLQQCGVTTLLTKTSIGGLSAQMRMAFDYALEQGYQGIITIDGNNKDDPSAIPRFIDALKNGYDHIQGSRYIAGGMHENTPLSRHFAVKLIHAPLISLASSYRYTDTTNGFRGYSRKFLLDPHVNPFRHIFEKYELHYYLAIRAGKLGYKITETPVTRKYPAHGKTPTKIKGIKGNMHILKTLYNAISGKFNPVE